MSKVMGIFERFRSKKEQPVTSKVEAVTQPSIPEWMRNKDTLLEGIKKLQKYIGELDSQEADDYVKAFKAAAERKDITAVEAQEILNSHHEVIKGLREKGQLQAFFKKIAPSGRQERLSDLGDAQSELGKMVK